MSDDERPPTPRRRRSPRKKRRRRKTGASLSSSEEEEEMDDESNSSSSSSSSIAVNATSTKSKNNHPSSVLLVGKTRGAGGRSSGGSRRKAAANNNRKRKAVVGKGGGGREEEEEQANQLLKIDANKNNVTTTIDLRGHANTPDELKRYLMNDNNEKSPSIIKQQKLGGGGGGGEQQVVRQWSVITDVFPRGCMQVLLDHIVDGSNNNIRITKFVNHYGNIYKYQIQNPDLKLLLKHHGKWLTHLRITPLNNTKNNSPPAAPKLQGCGYRWITLHTRQLQVLELSLLYDTKQQLLDLSSRRRTPLRVSALREIVLRDVRRVNNNQQQLLELIARATNLERLVLAFVVAEDQTTTKKRKRNDNNIVSLL